MLRQLGLVVHPSRDLSGVLGGLTAWASEHGAAVGQVSMRGQQREVAEPVAVEDCDLLVALGGDGTTLTALHAGAPQSRAVLGIACGSVGALTSVAGDRLGEALDQVDSGAFTEVDVPALEIRGAGETAELAINDLTVIRDGPGQLLVSVAVDGVLYVRVAGDGLVVATALGSSAYTMAAGGPILAPGADGMAITPLAPHGGSSPPLVTGPDSEVDLELDPGHGGVRHEIDGRLASLDGERLAVRQRPAYAKLVQLEGEEARLTGLRRRGLVTDGPRVLVHDARTRGAQR
jgi:NAD+ kinase